ncbi:hypothetical protein SAMN06265375_1011434 [Muriicola jejuensis]|uniref:Uncharacterized protein n=1 Tax=Muriicola jejuensis TaxID=504488 RepID=A0A6P0U942_9FLAO|nr:hypothetical protein [Muriicola jejuensis]NER09082.1 hypothetical protein [Muriicola jejuensis]SMP11380.1 hypothetical protein SAMN06265375_1011434 [Muriicola jejuensis]
MKTIPYYPTIFHTNPFAYKMSDIWELSEYNAIKILLRNQMATEQGVTEMILNIANFAAIDESGKEHIIKDFDDSSKVNLKGTHTGLYLKTNSAVDLEPGKYTKLRFYLRTSGNTLILKDKSEKKLSGRKYLDFEIRNGLEIHAEDKKPLILRFDFEPYSLASFFKPLTDLLKRQKRTVGKLVNSFAQ